MPSQGEMWPVRFFPSGLGEKAPPIGEVGYVLMDRAAVEAISGCAVGEVVGESRITGLGRSCRAPYRSACRQIEQICGDPRCRRSFTMTFSDICGATWLVRPEGLAV